MGAYESGQSLIASVLAKLPEGQREAARAIFEAAEAKDAVSLVGDSALARSDYSRSMDTLREKEGALNDYYTRLDGWYTDNKARLDASYAGDPATPPAKPTPQPTPQPDPTPQGGGLLTPAGFRGDESSVRSGGSLFSVARIRQYRGGSTAETRMSGRARRLTVTDTTPATLRRD